MKVAKLVRDRTIEVIRQTGEEPDYRVAAPEELLPLLRAKPREEVDEFLDSQDPEELVDILEVVRALGQELGVSAEELERLRVKKVRDRGAFTDRVVWLGNRPA